MRKVRLSNGRQTISNIRTEACTDAKTAFVPLRSCSQSGQVGFRLGRRFVKIVWLGFGFMRMDVAMSRRKADDRWCVSNCRTSESRSILHPPYVCEPARRFAKFPGGGYAVRWAHVRVAVQEAGFADPVRRFTHLSQFYIMATMLRNRGPSSW